MPLARGYVEYVKAQLEDDSAWLEKLDAGAAGPSPAEQALAHQHAGIVRERIHRWKRILADDLRAAERSAPGRG
jgi:hypothetical protein